MKKYKNLAIVSIALMILANIKYEEPVYCAKGFVNISNQCIDLRKLNF